MSKPEQPASAPAREPIQSDISQEFLREHLRTVFLVAFCITSNRAEAQEIAQEAFIGVLQRYGSVAKNPRVGIAVRESAISSAVRVVRRNAIESAGAVRSHAQPRPAYSDGEDARKDAKWGERVVVLLHDTQALSVRKIANLLDCKTQVIVTALVRARREMVPSGALPHPQTGSHIPDADLVLAGSALKPKLPVRFRLHLGKCVRCQNALKQFNAAADANRRAGLDELRAVEAFTDWPALEREMTGNIAVGVAAARCIQHVHRKRRSASRMALFATCLCVLFGLGWMTHVPATSTQRLLHTLGSVFTLHRISTPVRLAGDGPDAIYARSLGRKVFEIEHPESAAIRLTDEGQIQATFVDSNTGQVMQDSLWTRNLAAVPLPVPFLHINIPRDAPVSVQGFSITPLQQPVRRASGTRPFRVSVELRNTGTKSISAVVFRGAFQNHGFLSQASLGAEGLSAGSGETVTVTADFAWPPDSAVMSTELTLDFILFSDLTSIGSDTPEHRELIADEVASRSERDYLRSLFGSGQLAAARSELNSGDESYSGGDFEVLDRPSTTSPTVSATRLDGAPLVIESYGWTGKLQFTLFNHSSRPVSWYRVTVASLDSSGRLLFSEDVRRTMRVEPLQKISLTVEDRVRSTAVQGTLAKRIVFLRAAQFADGSWWVANSHVANGVLRLVRSPAQVQLEALFRRGGLAAVQQDLQHASK